MTNQPQRVHFVGVAGAGISAIASIAHAQGFKVTGCDKVSPFNEFTKNIPKTRLKEGHSSNHIKNVDIVAYSPSIVSVKDHPELSYALDHNIPIMTWQEFMGKYLEKDKFVIAICGTHGKSTTTAIAGLMLEEAGLDPTVELGSVVPKWGVNYRVGKSKYFVTEADEFNNNYMWSKPEITIITSVEMDHPSFFKDFEAVKNSFTVFLKQTKKKIIANLSNRGVKEVLQDVQGVALNKKATPWTEYEIVDYSKRLIDFPLKVPGEYNIMNASAVYQLGILLKIDPKIIKHSLSNFTGIGRRFEFLGNYKRSKIYSDYAHHPTALDVTMRAARKHFPKDEIVLIFQPHGFARTKVLFKEFTKVLQTLPVDKAIITDIFYAREVDDGLINSKRLVEKVNKQNVIYIPKDSLEKEISQTVQKDQIIFFVGAGDIDKLAKKLISKSALKRI